MSPPGPLLLVLDGNSLTHRAYHAAPIGRLLDGAGRPIWALHGLIGYLAKATAKLRPDAVLVGFDCPRASVRKDEYPGYKAHRPDKPIDLLAQLLAAPDLLRAAGIATVVALAHEADDVLASAAARARAAGWRAIVMTSDRDSFALLDETTSVLRVRNGGLDEAVLVTPASLYEVYGVHPWQYRDYAALRGDPSDNLPGVRGFGAATAARLLASFGTIEAAWAALDDGGAQAVRSVVGEVATAQLAAPESRQVVARNRSLMRLRSDLDIPDLDSMRLPLDLLLMRRTFAQHGINLGPSLWALGQAPPPPDEVPMKIPQPWIWRRSPRAPRDPAPGQLALF